MPNPVQPEFRYFSFSGMFVDVEKREIYDPQGVRRRLVGKPFDVLVFLASNHERFVSSEELLDEFWNIDDADGGDSDPQNVHKAISKIRHGLGDPAYVITERSRGARIAGPVTFPAAPPAAKVDDPAGEPALQGSGQVRPDRSFRWGYVIPLLILAVVVSVGLALLPVGDPIVISGLPITHTGTLKYAPVIVNGNDRYFTEVVYGKYRIVRLKQASNETAVIPSSVPNPYLCDISPRGDLLLRNVIGGFDDYGPLFIQEPGKAVADPIPVTALDAVWSPDGKVLSYCRGPEVELFDFKSKVSTTVARISGYAWWPRWSRNGKFLRFTVSDPQSQLTSIWQVGSDGSGLHQLFKPSDRWFHAGAGSWTSDGRYFLFQVGPQGNSKLWVFDEGWLAVLRKRNPFQLSSETSLRGPILGRTIFARSHVYRGELRKLALVSGAQTGIPTQNVSDMVAYSPDGAWMVYCVSDQEQSLWLSKVDGSWPRMLIGPPLQSAFPVWSPKGDRIALVTRRFDDAWSVTVVSPWTGRIERLQLIPQNALHPSWSPDGTRLVFGTIPTLNENAYLYEADLVSRRASPVPGSQGLFTPAWSPNGRYIVALKADSYQLVLFDEATSRWTFFPGLKFGCPVWSKDSQYIYTFRNETDGPRFYRIQISTGAMNEVLYLPGFRLLERWIGVHPDGSLLAAANIGIQEIFALKLDRPLARPVQGN